MDNAQKEKAAALERAVINCSVEELSKIYGELGDVEMTAPALGIACRFRGLDVVKVLVEREQPLIFHQREELRRHTIVISVGIMAIIEQIIRCICCGFLRMI